LAITAPAHRHIHTPLNSRQTQPIHLLVTHNPLAHIHHSNSINTVVWLLPNIKEDQADTGSHHISNTQRVQVALIDLINLLDIPKVNGRNNRVTIHHLKAMVTKPRKLFPILVD
jgi:hypothetical protein